MQVDNGREGNQSGFTKNTTTEREDMPNLFIPFLCSGDMPNYIENVSISSNSPVYHYQSPTFCDFLFHRSFRIFMTRTIIF